MDASCEYSRSSSSSLGGIASLPSPKSPPGYPDLYGKRRQLAKVQVLEREIGLLEEELKSLQGLQPASKCCKELDEFIGAIADPFVAPNQKIHRPHFWKRLWGRSCFKLPCFWCCTRCSFHLKTPNCCFCFPSDQSQWPCSCLKRMSCQSCCNFPALACRHSACSKFKLIFSKWRKVKLCSDCAETCSNPCCLQY